MAFKAGQSGNPDGRPKGATNKLGIHLKDRIADFLDLNWQTVQEDFDQLTPFERFQVSRGLTYYDILNNIIGNYPLVNQF